MAINPRLQELYERRKREITHLLNDSSPSIRFLKEQTKNKKKYQNNFIPKREVARTSKEQQILSLSKFHQVSDTISHYYISPAKELVYDKESFNAAITFTILTSILQNSSMIYFGSPGSGKTTLAEYVSSAIFNIPLRQIQQATIYGHPELTEEKMIAMYDTIKMLNEKKELIVRDFAKTPVRIIDEVNRIPPSKLSILYQLADRGWTTYQNEMIVAKPGPLFATANSLDSGNYDLPIPFLDRFDIGIVVQDLDPYHYREFVKNRSGKIKRRGEKQVQLANPITSEDIVTARKAIYKVAFPNEIMSYFAHFSAELKACDQAGTTADKKSKANALYKKPGPLCRECSYYQQENAICSSTENAISARSVSSIYSYAKALAAWRNTEKVSETDLEQVLAYGTWFKLSPTRMAFTDQPSFANDRIAWVKHLYAQSRNSFDEIKQKIPAYQEITELVFQQSLSNGQTGFKVKKQDLDLMLNELAQVKSLAKFPLEVTLRSLYQEAK